jgi:hypothetical protein
MATRLGFEPRLKSGVGAGGGLGGGLGGGGVGRRAKRRRREHGAAERKAGMAHMRMGKEACAAPAGMEPGNNVGLTLRESQSICGRPGQCMRPQAVARLHSWRNSCARRAVRDTWTRAWTCCCVA